MLNFNPNVNFTMAYITLRKLSSSLSKLKFKSPLRVKNLKEKSCIGTLCSRHGFVTGLPYVPDMDLNCLVLETRK